MITQILLFIDDLLQNLRLILITISSSYIVFALIICLLLLLYFDNRIAIKKYFKSNTIGAIRDLGKNQNQCTNILNRLDSMVSEIYVSSKNNSDDFMKSMEMLSIEIWKMNKKVQKIKEQVDENTIKGFEFSIEKALSIIDKHGIKIIDYTLQKYLDGMTGVEVISIEKDENLSISTIIETIEPGIEVYGNLMRRSKVVVLSPL